MSKLVYKTRGMTSPRGKSRVYFCCHPEDYPLYLEEVSGEILAKQNCSFWYQEEPDAVLTEQERDDLAHMQLFVMPVTRRLLQTENPALEEFAFAVEHHIPVLPLMQESGLEDLFNQKCGDLQVLNKHAYDALANLCRDEGDYEGALAYYSYVMQCDRKIAGASRSLCAYRDQSLTLYRVGECLYRLGRNREALEQFQRVRRISEAVLRESGALQDMQALYDALEKMRMIYREEDEKTSETACTREMATYAGMILEQDKSLKAVRRAAMDYYTVAADAGKCRLKDANLIKDAYEKAVCYAEKGMQSYSDPELISYLFVSAGMLGVLQEKENKKTEAALTYLRGIRAVSGMLDQLENERDRKNLSVLVLRLHKLYRVEQTEDIKALCMVVEHLACRFPEETEYDTILDTYGCKNTYREKLK